MMKKLLFLLLILFLSSSNTFSQSLDIANSNFRFVEEINCPFHPLEKVTWPSRWMLYQTLDDTWNGPVDSSICISGRLVEDPTLEFAIDLSQIDRSRALFVRQQFEGEKGIVLRENAIYESSVSIRLPPEDSLLIGNFCETNVCSGVILSVEIPDENGTATASRINTTNFSSPNPNNYRASAGSCLITEYFPEGNVLRNVVLKFRFEDERLDTNLRLRYANIYDLFSNFESVNLVEELVFPESTFDGTTYMARMEEVALPAAKPEFGAFLLLHEEGTYPKPGNETYIEARPEIPTSEPAQLRVRLTDYEPLHVQPYTELRGALVQENDTARHQLTLVGENSELCLASIIELVVGPGAELEFRSGNIEFAGPNSCIMLRDGGALSIPDNTRFVYGRGEGALGLDKGGTIRIGHNSELVINNTAILANFVDGPDRQVYMDLLPGSRLTFGEKSRLIRKGHVEDGHMLLNVYMKGGLLDDRNLSARDRRLIRRIYPNDTQDQDWVRLLGNPTHRRLGFSVEVLQNDASIYWQVQDLNGRPLQQGRLNTLPGWNEHTIELGDSPTGLYILQVQGPSGTTTRKFIVQH